MPPEDQILQGSTKTQEKGQLDVVALVVSCSAGTDNCGHQQRSRHRTQSPGNGVSCALTTTKRPNFVFMSIHVFRLTQKKAIWIGLWHEYLESLIDFSEVMLWQKQCCPLVSEGGFPQANNVCRIILWNVFSFHICNDPCRLPIELFQSNLYLETFPQKYSDAGAKSDWLNSPNQSVRTWEHVQFIVFRNYFAQ